MSANPSTVQALQIDGLNTLQIGGLTITKDIAKQLDQLHSMHDHTRFEPLGRVRTGQGFEGMEVLGRDTATGALVIMRHTPNPRWVTEAYDDAGKTRYRTANDGKDELRNALTNAYSQLPLIVLPKDGRP
ncbi:hypothetical protein [Arthrobacter sp. U41]|uniref:hypothetical protein n=1 Tax=Arthrobacter sp. U41 TaxID=1849032 RepID=UPI0008595338|nr:hypothetical protein [Arthrobacter sp. U41]AOT04937.1 hypothetical protein ASPU41_18065 [Arthrobacter sp. U41]